PSANKRLRELDRIMAKLRRQQEKLNDALLATTDRDKAAELGRELHVVRSELGAAELEWLELATS
ncbi:MAG: ABC transporter ATP-binding protein, partial [Actinomycetota bacterium]